MSRFTVLAVRIVLGLVLLGSVGVQVVMVPLFAADLDELNADYAYLRVPLIVLALLGILGVQIALVCVWRLVTMVRRGSVFSDAAFRFVDITIGAITGEALLAFALGALLAPGEAVPPGMVLLIGGAGVLTAGVALIVLVLRLLLVQAIARDAEATQLEAELHGVI
jgi:hypothetical protein